VLLLVAALALPAAAELSPAKPTAHHPAPPPNPELIRQGGDTIADAVPLEIPTWGMTGTTTGYTDDYELPYPFGGGTAPDVVYSIVPDEDMLLDLDLCQSSYDTKVWIWDAGMGLPPVAWNDDFYVNDPDCGNWTSKIERASLVAGTEYYIIVDGYADDHGDYVMDLYPTPTCDVDCPAGATMEGEPPLTAGYVDLYNGGCPIDPDEPPIQLLESSLFCGVTGWFSVGTSNEADTDWLEAVIPVSGELSISVAAEMTVSLDFIALGSCESVYLYSQVLSNNCSEPDINFSGPPGQLVWLRIAPVDEFFWPLNHDAYEFRYVLTTSLNPVTVEQRSWSTVKGLFR
jgi:hypothetical protein